MCFLKISRQLWNATDFYLQKFHLDDTYSGIVGSDSVSIPVLSYISLKRLYLMKC